MAPRSFYRDDEETAPVPGLTTTALDQKVKESTSVQATPNTKIFEGMTIRTSPTLEKYAHDLRHWTINKLDLLNAETANLRSATNNELNNIKEEYHQVVVEPILPQSIQILIASLTGSILVNRKSLPLRFITPLVFGLVTFKFVMPQTCSNVFGIVRQYESQYLPQVDQFHRDTNSAIAQTVESSEKLIEDANSSLVEGVSNTRKSLISWLTNNK